MKKSAFLVVLGLFASMTVFAATTGDTTVTASVAQLLSITSPATVALGTLTPGTATVSPAANLTARSNVRSWSIKAYALLGKLTEYDATEYAESTPVGYNTAEQIGYTLAVDGETAAAVPAGDAIVDAVVFATFSAKTTGGTTGQAVPFVITAATEGATTWQAGNYQDVITFVIVAN